MKKLTAFRILSSSFVFYILYFTFCILLFSCSVQKQSSRSSQQTFNNDSSLLAVINDSSLLAAHVGISVFDPSSNKYLYNYQGDKYFVPASNTKIPTCYAAMKYLGDSLVGLKVAEYKTDLFLLGVGDPTLLHDDFKIQPVYNFLKSLDTINKNLWGGTVRWEAKSFGSGWAWNDFESDYMAERSALPIYGNVISFSGKAAAIKITPASFLSNVQQLSNPNGFLSRVERTHYSNDFKVFSYGNTSRIVKAPFITSDTLNFRLLSDTLKMNNQIAGPNLAPPVRIEAEEPKTYSIHSQPTDSLLKPMMHRSDNFFAEQSLLMVSNEFLGVMNDAKIIDTILKTDFKDLPQKPRWADGSGLSRYNLFTPQDFVAILNKMKNEFGMERIKEIFPTGGEGTLSSYYKSDSTFIYAKTGTLSGVVALSGFLYTKKNKLLIFSVLVNNHQASATNVRRAVEKFIQGIRKEY